VVEMFGVRYLYIDNKDRIVPKEVYFKTEKAVTNHLQKLEDKGILYKIISYIKD
jgi:hypothetical protein